MSTRALRFHADVQATIDRVPMEVDELAVPLTDEMRAIQGALLELIDSCLFDLRRANPTVGGRSVPSHRAHPSFLTRAV